MRTAETDIGESRGTVSAPAAILRRRCVASSTAVPHSGVVARPPATGNQAMIGQPAQVGRQFTPAVVAVIYPLAVLILTPLILLAGIVAVVGALALGMSRRVRTRRPGCEAPRLASSHA